MNVDKRVNKSKILESDDVGGSNKNMELINKLSKENSVLWKEVEERDNYIAQLTLMNNEKENKIKELSKEIRETRENLRNKNEIKIEVERDDENGESENESDYKLLLNKFNKLKKRYNSIYKQFNKYLKENENNNKRLEEISLERKEERHKEENDKLKEEVFHLKHIIHIQHSIITKCYKDKEEDKEFISSLSKYI